jgi:phosphohistidine phosphatase
MKTLLVLRHAKSSWGEPGLSDHERPLTERGKEDAPRMGQVLREQGLVPDLIVSSTAKRARNTAKKVAQHCGYEDEVQQTETLYLAPAAQYIDLLRRLPDAYQTVAVVGHNPGLEELVELLTGQAERLPTAALAQIALDIAAWEQLTPATRGQLVHLWRPKEV